ncbi:hypothetical protein AKG79_07035 [Vibrio parahaemolyticus]|nr:hypothetical protein AKG79_07035 [Vibrio parahaemolyticus]
MKDRMPPLQGLYYFFIAAKEGSFKTAAKNLFVTPAAISQQIRQLEEFLGTNQWWAKEGSVDIERWFGFGSWLTRRTPCCKWANPLSA